MPVRKQFPEAEKKQQVQAPYSPEELEELKQMLLANRASIIQRLNHADDSLQDTRSPGEELADVGSDAFYRETQLKLSCDDRRRLDMLNDALAALAHGNYGICKECGQRIGIKRLMAKPYAKYCIDCRIKREQQNLPDMEL